MAIRTRDEIMDQLKAIIGEDTSDDTLTFIQDVSDTLADDTSAQRISDLEAQLADQDQEWRRKYRDAFFSGKPDEAIKEEDEEPPAPRKFEDLFTIG